MQPSTSLVGGTETAASKLSPFSLKAITETSSSILENMGQVGEAQTVRTLLKYIDESTAVQGMLRIDIGHVFYKLKTQGLWQSLTGPAAYDDFRDWCKNSEIAGTIDYEEIVFAISCYETAQDMEANELPIKPLVSTNMTPLKLGLVRRQIKILTDLTRQAVLNTSFTQSERDEAILTKRTEVKREITSILSLDQSKLKALTISANAPPGAPEPAYVPASNGRIVNGRLHFEVSLPLDRESWAAIRALKIIRRFHMQGHPGQMDNFEELYEWLETHNLIREPTVIDAEP